MVVGLIGAIAFVPFAHFALAAGKKANIQVSATILLWISQKVVHQKTAFVITAENVKEGFVDLPNATALKIKTNNPMGYYLTFEFNEEIIKEAWVIHQERTTLLTGGTSSVHYTNARLPEEIREISYRFILKPDTQPGQYHWPILLVLQGY